MLTKLRPRLSHTTVVAYLALFVALGGSGYAAVKINGKQLKNRSVAGKKLKQNTLSGKEVKESKLGKVPKAKLADRAGVATSAGAASFATTAGSATDASRLQGQPASAFAAAGCPGGMVKVGPTCIDRYEASIWTSASGGTQITGTIPCAANGQGCKGKIFARSVAGVTPRASITWFQAQQALANSGKRLPSNAEWQAAAAGTPDPGSNSAAPGCRTAGGSAVATGSHAACVSDWGVHDMVGNLWEWVADWDEQADDCASWPTPGPPDFGGDVTCFGDGTPSRFPGALLRGGDFGQGSSAGPFAVSAKSLPSDSLTFFGFRGAR